jgi:hypothetical protein
MNMPYRTINEFPNGKPSIRKLKRVDPSRRRRPIKWFRYRLEKEPLESNEETTFTSEHFIACVGFCSFLTLLFIFPSAVIYILLGYILFIVVV